MTLSGRQNRREAGADGWRKPEGGLRGSRVAALASVRERATDAGGGTSLMLSLLAAASRAGAWCAVVGVPELGALAAAESGVVLERLALVPEPGPEWPTVVAALIDGVDVVVAAVPGPVPGTVAGRLAARARQRGCVLVPFGDWAGADVTLEVSSGQWEGIGTGRGRLRRREVTVVARGRGAAARPREMTMWMPGVTVRSEPAGTGRGRLTVVPGTKAVSGAGAVLEAKAVSGAGAVLEAKAVSGAGAVLGAEAVSGAGVVPGTRAVPGARSGEI
ncbi:hypothetical protein [Actinoplanes sp. NBRC 101535]|uniref:hypothetical protein n=1 Tax=Actinoplanes sp. NBRC 101535 TaxID=3032196 RepID=UPI0025544496|nr:hypothetical protein [Actinoplanes sp. NBRC 101535]